MTRVNRTKYNWLPFTPSSVARSVPATSPQKEIVLCPPPQKKVRRLHGYVHGRYLNICAIHDSIFLSFVPARGYLLLRAVLRYPSNIVLVAMSRINDKLCIIDDNKFGNAAGDGLFLQRMWICERRRLT